MNNIINMIPNHTFVSKLLPFSQTIYYFKPYKLNFERISEHTDNYFFNNNKFQINYKFLQTINRDSPYDSINITALYNLKNNIKFEEYIHNYNSDCCTYINNNYQIKLEKNGFYNSIFEYSNLLTQRKLNINFYKHYNEDLKKVHDIFIHEIKALNIYSKDL